MTWKCNRWTVIVVALFITVAVLVGGQLLWNNYGVKKPLDKSLQIIPGIEAVTWAETGKNTDSLVITVTLGKVSDLQQTYKQIVETSKQVLGRRPFTINLKDHRSPELEALYYDSHYYVQEAIVTGKFTSMAEAIKARAADSEVEEKVYVDDKYVYIGLSKGQSALYAVVNRSGASQEVK
ncbi:MAG: hypothetical protein H6Q74_514 [Firmicutes bacterium]|nr:hypothetical protein [Bacillota bacterium]